MSSTTKLRWGILGCANIAIGAVIPGIKQSETGIVSAIASRNLDKAQSTAQASGIPTAYASYEELLADSSIDAVYIPLPNHLPCMMSAAIPLVLRVICLRKSRRPPPSMLFFRRNMMMSI